MAARSSKLLNGVREVLTDRMFTNEQIENILPRLARQHFEQPKTLAKIIDTWNIIMGTASTQTMDGSDKFSDDSRTPMTASPSKSSLLGNYMKSVDMRTVLGNIEPDLLLFDPDKLRLRHQKVQGLGFAKDLGEYWLLVYNAPRGFYLQDWLELSKKLYYIEHYLIDFLYDKKEVKEMKVHPIIKSASIVEAQFDHIRTRYLFAQRCGYKALSHLYSVQVALERPKLSDLVTSDIDTFLRKFAPFCSLDEYKTFADLIKNYDHDEDDAQIFEKLAELNAL